MELGGNILLEGFEDKDFTELIVVKKIVGQYARHLTDNVGAVEKLAVVLADDGGKHAVTTTVILAGNQHDSSVSRENLYMALDQSLKELVDKAT